MEVPDQKIILLSLFMSLLRIVDEIVLTLSNMLLGYYTVIKHISATKRVQPYIKSRNATELVMTSLWGIWVGIQWLVHSLALMIYRLLHRRLLI